MLSTVLPMTNSVLPVTNNNTIINVQESLVPRPPILTGKNQPSLSHDLLYIVLVVTIVEPYRDLKEYFQSPCAGTMIRRDLVLTTASCLLIESHDDPDPTGTAIYQRHGKTLRALKIFVHPEYSLTEKYNYAVVVVEKSTLTVFPKLPKNYLEFVNVMNNCFVGGYGNQHRLLLRNFQVTRLNESQFELFKCRERPNRPDQICLHFLNLMPCRGDVGSPMICGGELFALYTPRTQSGPKCIDRYGIIFTPIYPVMEWINRIVSAPTSNLEWMNNPWYILLLCGTVLAVIGGIYYGLVEFLQKTFMEQPLGERMRTSMDSQYTNPRPNERMQWTV